MKARLYLLATMSAAITVLFTSESNFLLDPLEIIVNGKAISLSGQVIVLLVVSLTLCLIFTLGIIDRIILSFGTKGEKEIDINKKK
ncbi:hypothetical protein OAJ35_03330 [Gammaproteobacteria bacterium]|nr:hypothetical protein [Gammaproteobacteria bacterium]